MNTRRKRFNNDNNNNNNNEISKCQLKLQGNKQIFIPSFDTSACSSRDVPAMNTRSRSIKRINSHTQQSQQREKKIKISNINELPEKELDLLNAEEAEVQIAPIEKLFDDCLEEIFMYLSPEERLKNELVCKKWRSINRSIIKRIKKLHFHYVEPDKKYFSLTLGKSGGWIMYNIRGESLLEFKQRFNYVPRLLQLTGQYLRELDLSALTNSVILTKLKEISFPHLIKLKLRLYIWNYQHNDYWFKIRKNYQYKHCDNLFDKMIKLESLHLTTDFRQRIPKNFIIAMLPLANTLKELSVINNIYDHTNEKNATDAFWSGPPSFDKYLPMLNNFQSLRFLEIKFYKLVMDDFQALRHLNLEKLVIARCLVSSESVNRLNHLLNMKSLKELALGICGENIDAFLKQVPNNFENLTKLILFRPNATAHRINVISSVKRFQTIVVNDHKELEKIMYT